MRYGRRGSAPRLHDVHGTPTRVVTLRVRMPRARVVDHIMRVNSAGWVKFHNHDPRAERTAARLVVTMRHIDQGHPEAVARAIRTALVESCRCWKVLYALFRHGRNHQTVLADGNDITLKALEDMGIKDEASIAAFRAIDLDHRARFVNRSPVRPGPKARMLAAEKESGRSRPKLPGWENRFDLQPELNWRHGHRKPFLARPAAVSYGEGLGYERNDRSVRQSVRAVLSREDARLESAFHPFDVLLRREMATTPSPLTLINLGLLVIDNTFVTRELLRLTDTSAVVDAWFVDFTYHPRLYLATVTLARIRRSGWEVVDVSNRRPFLVQREGNVCLVEDREETYLMDLRPISGQRIASGKHIAARSYSGALGMKLGISQDLPLGPIKKEDEAKKKQEDDDDDE